MKILCVGLQFNGIFCNLRLYNTQMKTHINLIFETNIIGTSQTQFMSDNCLHENSLQWRILI